MSHSQHDFLTIPTVCHTGVYLDHGCVKNTKWKNQNSIFNKGTEITAFTVQGQRLTEDRQQTLLLAVTQLCLENIDSVTQIGLLTVWELECDQLLNSEHQRLRLFPGELIPAEVTVAGSGLVNWPLQTELSVRETQSMLYGYIHRTRHEYSVWSYEIKLHILHNDPWPQVKVLLYDLQQLVFVPGRRAVVKHWDGEWMAHTDGVGDLKGITDNKSIWANKEPFSSLLINKESLIQNCYYQKCTVKSSFSSLCLDSRVCRAFILQIYNHIHKSYSATFTLW